ncbi:M3 family metallopeptidase [Dysgonomonas sp. HGC4]|uniref:M3 family metallopeptidase n=1 Tax=Dysgonomonas sp. HGC4 TaxID=1658009 RepID=UPI0006815E8A|nr:M3 family metallopeptidase [Dysgonomonas sp. HGC4]MBD8347483.1 M3 family metallopeptidase [Dysgonomonas sp. HGC4]
MIKKFLFLFSLAITTLSYAQDNQNNIKQMDIKNPFLEAFKTPNGTPPFDLIKKEDYKPAFVKGIEQQAAEINAITRKRDVATFENTVVALDESGEILDRVSSVFGAIRGAQSDPDIQKIAEEISPLLSEHDDNIYLNEPLFARIKIVYADSLNPARTTEQKRLVEKYYKRFVRSGIALNAAQKDRLREINKELSLLSLSFGKNLLAETNNYELVIDNSKDLSGLSSDVINIAAKTAKEKGMDGKWVFTLSKPSWLPFLQYADNRDLREKLYKAMYSRGNNNNEFDNKKNINKIVNLRLEKANLLGYKSHADYVLDETMAKTPDNVFGLLNNIWEYALPQAKKEAAELQKMIDSERGNFQLASWDWWYYTEKLRKEKYALDEEALKPYFMVDNVRDGAFLVANKLYGITFKPSSEISIYHKDVQAFDVIDADGSFIGVLYLDYFPRASKRNGAWMGSFRKQSVKNGEFVNPIIYNVGNFALPTEDKPSLLTLEQVTTLFHEFGHGLHGLLSNVNYNGLSGTAVSRDFVELPSQIYEHWALHPEVLKLYAKHYQTGEVIPDALIAKMQEATNFNSGFETTEIVAAALLDMKWHVITEKQDFDVDAFESNEMNKIGLISEIIPRYKSTYFAHIFDGGYSAGYYSYLWSEVLDADAFEAFVEKGVFDRTTGQSFRDNILSKGGSEDPMTLYKIFRGAEPNPIYLLKNRGFIK